MPKADYVLLDLAGAFKVVLAKGGPGESGSLQSGRGGIINRRNIAPKEWISILMKPCCLLHLHVLVLAFLRIFLLCVPVHNHRSSRSHLLVFLF